MKPLNVAILGAGYIAHYHAKALKVLPNVNLTTVISKSLDSASSFATQYDIPFAGTSLESLFEGSGTDAVIIATPNKFHAPYTIACIDQGMDVLIEKPMAMTTLEGLQIKEAATRNQRIVMVGHMWRSDIETIFIRDVVESKVLGEIFKTKGYGIHQDWGPEGWFVEKYLAGGGALIDMGVHAIDTVRFILGDPQPISVYAKIDTRFGKYDVDDTGILLINWDNGTTSIVESGWWHPHMDGPEAATRLFGTKGYGSLFPTKITLSEGDGDPYPMPGFLEKESHCDQMIYDAQMKAFISSVRTRVQSNADCDVGLCVLKIVDAAYKSSEIGEVVKI